MSMLRTLKTPTLRMMEGGEMPSAGAQMYGRASANLASMVDTSLGMSGVKPLSSPTAGPKPISRHDGMFSNPLAMPAIPQIGMKNGGDLRTGMGGHVPGSGSGDKIPAKYEPGEFVVSNDMLDAAPSLRSELHSLRTAVLAKKDMTPEQADAKAVNGGTLRANTGYGLYPYNRPKKDIYAGLGKPASAPENQPGPGGMLAPQQLQGAQNGQNQTTVAGAGPSGEGGATGNWGGGGGAPGVPGSQGRVLRLEVPEAVKNYRSPLPDMFPATAAKLRQGGAERSEALDQGKYIKAGFSAVGDAVSVVPKIADDILGGFARGSFNLLRNPVEDAGRAAFGMEDRKEAPPVNAVSPATTPGIDANTPGKDPGRLAAAAPNSQAYQIRQGTFGENDNAYHGDLTGKINAAMKSGQTDLASTGMRANDIYKTKSANGTTSYSGYGDGSGKQGNIVSGDGTSLRSGGSVSSVPGVSKELIAQTLRNPDGSNWSAADNAMMAANLRDGAAPYAGTSRASRGSSVDEQLQQAMAAYADPNRKFGTGKALRTQIEALTQRANNENSNRTTLRGQDMEREDRRAAAEGASAAAQRAQANDDRKYEMDVARFGVEAANKTRDDKRAGEEAFTKRVASLAGVDKEGKPDAALASATLNSANAFLANEQAIAEATLKADPNNKGAAAALEHIKKHGPAGIDEKKLRELMLDQKVKSVAKKGAGSTPWGGTAANSDKPLTSLRFEDSWLPFADKYVGDNGLVLTDDDFEANPDFLPFLGAKTK